MADSNARRKSSAQYEQHLAMLQEKNRFLKREREKDTHTIEMNKREKGFLLYFNHLSQGQGRPPTVSSRQHLDDQGTSSRSSVSERNPTERTRSSKTADSRFNEYTDEGDASRAKSAPPKRKIWKPMDVDLRADEGEPVHVEVPALISGNYEDDFENSSTNHSSDVALRESSDRDSLKFNPGSEENSCSEDMEEDDDDDERHQPQPSPRYVDGNYLIGRSASMSLIPLRADQNRSLDLLASSGSYPSITNTATRSLSATVRKKVFSSGEDVASLKETQAVLKAVQSENEAIDKISTSKVTVPIRPVLLDYDVSKLSKPQTKSKLDYKTKSELNFRTKSELDSQTKSKLDTKTKSELNFQTKSELDSQTKSDQTKSSQAKSELDSQTKSELDSQTKSSQTKSKLDSQTKSSQTKSEHDSQLKSELDSQTKSELDSQTKSSQTKSKLDSQTKSSQTKSKLDSQTKSSQTKSEHDSQLKSELDSQTKSELDSQTKSSQTKSKLDSQTKSSQTKSEHDSQPKSELDSQTKSELDSSEVQVQKETHSMTEHTLRIVTDKIRTMNSRQQHRLLNLLGKIDNASDAQLGSSAQDNTSPPPTDQGSSTSESEDLRKIWFGAENSSLRRNSITDETLTQGEQNKDKSRPRSTCRKTQLFLDDEDMNMLDSDESVSHISVDSQKPTTGRMTGLRGEQVTSSGSGSSRPASNSSRPASKSRHGSGRTTGYRAKLEEKEETKQPSQVESQLPTILDGDEDSLSVVPKVPPSSAKAPRLRTAVLAKGNRPLLLGTSNSDSRLLPVIIADDNSMPSSHNRENPDNGRRRSRLNSKSYSHHDLLSPISSQHDPEISSSAQDQSTMDLPPPEQPSADDCLASVSKFDRSHYGKIGSDMQDDIMETFLSDYRTNKKQPDQSSRSKSSSASSRTQKPSPPQPSRSPTKIRSSLSHNELGITSTNNPPVVVREEREEKANWLKDKREEETNVLVIPELPIGRVLIINILSTWGDRYYVGLTGIEIYTAVGKLARIKEISAEPSDINVLPEYSNDPRVVTNLIDGITQTRDDLHMWLTPFTPQKDHLIYIEFTIPYALAMIRIWNYNKSRIHSSRGARQIEMFLDDQMIFAGEVAQASGRTTKDTSGDFETILFTVNVDVLQRVSQNDPVFLNDHTTTTDRNSSVEHETQRPRTADHLDVGVELDHRPFTSANSLVSEPRPVPTGSPNAVENVNKLQTTTMPRSTENITTPQQTTTTTKTKTKMDSITASIVQIILENNWGDPFHIGLTSIGLLEANSRQLIPLRPDQLSLSFCDENEDSENPELQKLVDGVDVTNDPSHMWSCPVKPSAQHCPTITVTLDSPTAIHGIRVWNYNATMEDSFKGAKLIYVYVDNSPLKLSADSRSAPTSFIMRRAPGHVQYNYCQDILFQSKRKESQLQVPSDLPRGFVFQLQLFSTWGDPYYLGLNGIEFYDGAGDKVPLTENNIAAFPDSINDLPDVSGDLRTPNKLVDGVCDTMYGRHMWLAPVLPDITNSVFVIFDEPQSISLVKIWNYTKTQSRGVKELALLVDDLLVFSGTIPSTPTYARGILPTLELPPEPYIINFTLGHRNLLSETASTPAETREGDVQFTNEQQVVSEIRTKPHKNIPDQDLRPLTSLTQSKCIKNF